VYASCKIRVEIDALRVVELRCKINLTTQTHELALGFLIRIPVRTYEGVEQKRRIFTCAIHHFTFPFFFQEKFSLAEIFLYDRKPQSQKLLGHCM
jgi:hypothetical protein